MKVNQRLKRDIEKYKSKLIEKAKRSGLYENFGDKEERKLEEKYIDISSYTDEMNQARDLIGEFFEWASCYEV